MAGTIPEGTGSGAVSGERGQAHRWRGRPPGSRGRDDGKWRGSEQEVQTRLPIMCTRMHARIRAPHRTRQCPILLSIPTRWASLLMASLSCQSFSFCPSPPKNIFFCWLWEPLKKDKNSEKEGKGNKFNNRDQKLHCLRELLVLMVCHHLLTYEFCQYTFVSAAVCQSGGQRSEGWQVHSVHPPGTQKPAGEKTNGQTVLSLKGESS